MQATLAKVKELGLDLPESISELELLEMSNTNISNALRNIESVRKELIDCLSSAKLAHPGHEQLLLDWQRDCVEFNSGVKFEASNFEENNSRNGTKGLSLMAAWTLRHIMYDLNVPLWRLPEMWAAFYYLIMRKPISKESIAGHTSIWNHIR
jgi:hypothetical protein